MNLYSFTPLVATWVFLHRWHPWQHGFSFIDGIPAMAAWVFLQMPAMATWVFLFIDGIPAMATWVFLHRWYNKKAGRAQ